MDIQSYLSRLYKRIMLHFSARLLLELAAVLFLSLLIMSSIEAFFPLLPAVKYGYWALFYAFAVFQGARAYLKLKQYRRREDVIAFL